MAKKGRSSLFARLFRQTGLADDCASDLPVADAFDKAFSILRRSGCRDEYVYRAALTHNILLGTHSLNSASMLTEFRACSSKADVVILNGTATVYEIKSERDSLIRLSGQLADYQKVFAKVYVIAGESHVQDVIQATPIEVGVMSLSRRNRIQKVREAAHVPHKLSSVRIFESIRTSEACAILTDMNIPVPRVPNTRLHREMRSCFEQLDAEQVHRAMVKTLKRSRNLCPLGELVDQLPLSLQPAALSIQVRRADHERLIEAVQTPLSLAVAWN